VTAVFRATLPHQRHTQLREAFLALTNQRLDLAPGSVAYQTKCTEIDQVLASVWLLGTIYQLSPNSVDARSGDLAG
jgi:hypothetical protein